MIDSGLIESDEIWANIKASLIHEIARRKQRETVAINFQSLAEECAYNIVCKALSLSNIRISSNEYLFDLFESDIVIRIPFSNMMEEINTTYLPINIEVDGLHHRQSIRKRFCSLRDKYLKSQGVTVNRIETSRLRNMNRNDVEDWILHIVAHAILSPVAV